MDQVSSASSEMMEDQRQDQNTYFEDRGGKTPGPGWART